MTRFRCERNLAIIVPTYNERDNISELVTRIEDSLNSVDFELLFVDDNSPDGTSKTVEELNVDYGNLGVLKRKGKFGLSSAVTEGFAKARSKATVFAVIDADLQHPPELLLAMYKKITEGYDLVVASRYVEGGGMMKTFGLSRQIISRTATALTHFILPKTKVVNDVLSGFFMIKKNVLEGAKIEPIGYKILLELLVKGNYGKVYEVPYIFESRKNGKSNLGFKEIKDYLIQLRMLIKTR